MESNKAAIIALSVFAFLALASANLAAQQGAQLTYPTDGSTSIDPTVTFTWAPFSGAQVYYLYVGTAPGLKDVYDGGETKATSVTVRLPFGGTFYATVDTESNNSWHFGPGISFTTATPASLQSPLDKSSGVNNPVQFSWASQPGASVYYLYVGTTPGAKDAYDSGEVQTTQLTPTLSAGTYYALIDTKIGAHWYVSPIISFSVSAPPTPSQLTLPANGAVLSGASPISFAWTTVPNAKAYYLYVGTAPGLKDVIDSGEITFTQYSRTLNPGTYYAKMDTEIGQHWYFSSDISFSVVGSVLGFPQNGATNVDPYVNFSWTPFPNATGYSLSVGTSPGASDVLATGTVSATSYQVAAPLQPNTTYYVQLGTNTSGASSYTTSTFTTGTGIARLLSPADGAVNIDPYSKLNWNTVADAQTYYVNVGSAQGLNDVYNSGEIAVTSLAVPTLQPNTKYFVRLETEKNSQWFFSDSAFTTGTGIAQMVYPADKATNVDPALAFQWSTDPRALAYDITIGTAVGMNDIYDSGPVQGASLSIPDRCIGTCYIRLSTQRADGWRYVDSSFTVGDFISHLTAPANQSLADPTAMFTWTTVPNADAYYLNVGTTQGANDVFNSGELTVSNIFVPNLVAGTTYYVRLSTFRGGVWLYSDSTFQAGSGVAILSDPADGAAISPFETFTWTVPQFPGDSYYLIIGTAPGARDVFDGGATQATSVKPVGLDFGKTYYATLFSLRNSIWWPVHSTFTTLDQSAIPDLTTMRATFYAQVQQATSATRMMADPISDVPVAGSPLDALLKQNSLTSATCAQYSAILQTQLVPLGVRSRFRYLTLTGTSYESHTTLEYYDPFAQKWSVADATFGFLFFDPTTQTGQSAEDVQSLVLANSFAGIHVTTVTTYGDGILRAYYLDPLTLYTNVLPPDITLISSGLGPQPHSPFQFLQAVALDSIVGGPGGNYIFLFGDSSEQMQLVEGDGTGSNLGPTNGTLFSRGVATAAGWMLESPPVDLTAYTFVRPVY
jgi:hypothetical protein